MNEQFQQAKSDADTQQGKLKEQQLEEQNSHALKEKQQQEAQEALQQQLTQLEKYSKELADNLATEKSDIKLYQKEVESLKSKVQVAQEGQEHVLNRFNTNREKQEKDNDQVRETIKYLRDENSEMITQLFTQKEDFMEQIQELESKLTEYRLKFEYAQKQLSQNS